MTASPPIATCSSCAKVVPQAGGMWFGLRFLCAGCKAAGLSKAKTT